ncbi:MAG: hypothetical protein IJ371_01610 [Clostridia bacterium]|nr:hypothetical protein [Clostridia bacterium]
MSYIKDLYEKKPVIVKKLIKKLFNLEKEQDVFPVNPDEGLIGENDIMFNFINKKNGKVEVVVLEDFAICYGLKYLEMSDRRLREYLKFMAKLYGNKYLQGFHDYRTEERKELIGEFNAITYAMEAQLSEAINSMNKKEENKKI